MPGTEEANGDEDIIMEGSRGEVSKNAKCPITGVEVTLPSLQLNECEQMTECLVDF